MSEPTRTPPTHRCDGVNGAGQHGTQNKCTICGEYRNGWYDSNGMECVFPEPAMSETKAPELKPCPFCGKESSGGEFGPGPYLSRSQMSKFKSVICSGCCSIASGETEGRVIERWNTRVDLSPATPESSAEVRGPEDALHLAVCDAVQLLNSCVHTEPEQFQARDILRQALLDYADADVGPRTKAIREAQRNPATDVTAIMVSPASHVDEKRIAEIRARRERARETSTSKQWLNKPTWSDTDTLLTAYDELRAQLTNVRSAAIDEAIVAVKGVPAVYQVEDFAEGKQGYQVKSEIIAALEALKRDMRHGAALLTDAEVDAFLAEPIEPDPEQGKRVEQLFRRKMTDKADWEAK